MVESRPACIENVILSHQVSVLLRLESLGWKSRKSGSRRGQHFQSSGHGHMGSRCSGPASLAIPTRTIRQLKTEDSGNTKKNRNIVYRLRSYRIKQIAQDVATSTNVALDDLWLGGSQSPKSSNLPKEKSDVDFFAYPADFEAKNPKAWKKYAMECANLDFSKLEKKYGRSISLTFLPPSQKGQVEDQVRVKELA